MAVEERADPAADSSLPSFSSAEHREFFESIHDPVLVLRPADEVVLALNQSACELYGMTRDALLGTSLKALSCDVAYGEHQVVLTMDARGRHMFETMQTRADGTTMVLEVSAAKVLFDGEPAIFSINRQVGTRGLERQLRAHAQRLALSQRISRAVLSGRSLRAVALEALQAMVERTPQAQRASIVLFDHDRGVGELVAEVGPGPRRRHQDGTINIQYWSSERARRSAQVRYIPDLQQNECSALEGELLSRGLRCVFSVPLHDNNKLFGELNLASVHANAFSEQERARTIAMTHELGLALRSAQLRRALSQERQRLHDLVENLPDGVVLLDAAGKVLVTNEPGRALLDVVARAPGMQLPADDGPADSTRPQRLKPTPDHTVVEDGGRVVEAKMRRLSDRDGEPARWVLLLRDTSEERALQRKLREQERLAAVGQLAAGVAHDFNNLLQGISSYAELAMSHNTLPEEATDALASITTQTQRGKRVVRQILDFGRRSLSTRSVMDLAELLRNGMALLQRVLPPTMEIDLSCPDIPIWADVDPVQIQQMITNLALNARDAMPQGGTLALALSSDAAPPSSASSDGQDGDWLELRVSDTGHGIDEATLSRVFEPFFTTKSPEAGTGLGLAQVYGIIKQHGGHVEVSSEPGCGTTFRIRLPGSAAPARLSHTGQRPQARRGQNQLVLLVEDDPALRRSIARLIRKLGYRVVTAANGREALDLVAPQHESISLVLTDVVMPAMNGIELANHLRASYPALPIVFTTGHPLNETHEAHVRDHRWLHKPFSSEELSATIALALAEHDAA